MNVSRIYADFQKVNAAGFLVLTAQGSLRDLAAIVGAREGMRVVFYSDDENDSGEPDELEVDGELRFDRESHVWLGSYDPTETLDKIQDSGQLWGKPPRNSFSSDIPKAKAYEGALPEGARGFEFTTPILPDAGHVPGKPTWSGPRDGVTVDGDWAKIPVEIRRIQ
jgi:hypothetical protein